MTHRTRWLGVALLLAWCLLQAGLALADDTCLWPWCDDYPVTSTEEDHCVIAAPHYRSAVPSVVKAYRLSFVDARALYNLARRGEESYVEIPFTPSGGPAACILVRLQPHTIRAEGFRAFDGGQPLSTQPYTFRGKVVTSYVALKIGFMTMIEAEVDERSEVRLSLTPGFASGYIFYRGQWSFVEPLRRFNAHHVTYDHFVYNAVDTAFSLDLSGDVLDVPAALPVYHSAAGSGTGLGTIPWETDLSLVTLGDQAFKQLEQNRLGRADGWLVALEDILNGVEGIYATTEPDLYRRFRIGLSLKEARLEPALASSDGARLLAEAKRSGASAAHLVHVFTGKDLSYGGRNVFGLAHQGSVASNKGVSTPSNQSITQQLPEGQFQGLLYQRVALAAHELGHLNGARHADAGTVQMGTVQGPSLMSPVFNGGLLPAYSDNNDRNIEDLVRSRI